jgi:hypothetical protein
MGVTTIKAIVNMSPDIIVHLVEVGRNAPQQYPAGVSVDHPPLFGKIARPMDVTGEMAIRVPWCTSQEDFDNLHLVVQFIDPSSGALGYRSFADFSIWQQERGGADLVRLTDDGTFGEGRGLVADRDARTMYDPRPWADVILVVDERQWITLRTL